MFIGEEKAIHVVSEYVKGNGEGESASAEIPAQYLPLLPNTHYEWRVDSYNGCWSDATVGPTTGDTWVFETGT